MREGERWLLLPWPILTGEAAVGHVLCAHVILHSVFCFKSRSNSMLLSTVGRMGRVRGAISSLIHPAVACMLFRLNSRSCPNCALL
jgi:hypothetical protein